MENVWDWLHQLFTIIGRVGPIEIVDVFRPSRDVPAIAQQAIDIGAKVLWTQLGVIHEEAAAMARKAGLEVVMDRCCKIEHARFFGGLRIIGLNTGVITSRLAMRVPEAEPALAGDARGG